MKTMFKCPLCENQSAYIPDYGMRDSVICKCQGLLEVGRYDVKENVFIPHVSLLKISTDLNPSLPPVLSVGKQEIKAGEFTLKLLETDREIASVSREFDNLLQVPRARQMYMTQGSIWVARHGSNESRDAMLFIRTSTKRLEHFFLRKDVPTDIQDRLIIEQTLELFNLIA